jgi:hypothetical protein
MPYRTERFLRVANDVVKPVGDFAIQAGALCSKTD